MSNVLYNAGVSEQAVTPGNGHGHGILKGMVELNIARSKFTFPQWLGSKILGSVEEFKQDGKTLLQLLRQPVVHNFKVGETVEVAPWVLTMNATDVGRSETVSPDKIAETCLQFGDRTIGQINDVLISPNGELVDGHTRWFASLSILFGIAISEKGKIDASLPDDKMLTVENPSFKLRCKVVDPTAPQFESADSLRAFQLSCNQPNSEATRLDRCDAIRKLVAKGWSYKAVGVKFGITDAEAFRLRALSNADSRVRSLISAGKLKSQEFIDAYMSNNPKDGSRSVDAETLNDVIMNVAINPATGELWDKPFGDKSIALKEWKTADYAVDTDAMTFVRKTNVKRTMAILITALSELKLPQAYHLLNWLEGTTDDITQSFRENGEHVVTTEQRAAMEAKPEAPAEAKPEAPAEAKPEAPKGKKGKK